MMGTRKIENGIRVNGIITPHADKQLYAYLLQMPAESGERMRALKQLAAVGLVAMQGRLVMAEVQASAVAAAPEETAPEAAQLESLAETPPSAAPVERQVQNDEAKVSGPAQSSGSAEGGDYDLSDVDLDGVALTF